MKKNFWIFIIVVFISSCGQKHYELPLTAQVTLLHEEPYKTIEVRSIGYGYSADEALLDAERKAFKIIMFRGIPNTSVERPLVGPDEKKLLHQHAKYFNEFFNGRYKSFIITLYNASPPTKEKGIYTAAVDLKINLMSLKRDLEEHGVIRRFGF